jgi:anti-sigma factor RsiW
MARRPIENPTDKKIEKSETITTAKARELMPLYASGALSGEEQTSMENLFAANPALQQEFVAEQQIAVSVRELLAVDEMEVMTERSLADMHARITAAQQQKTPAPWWPFPPDTGIRDVLVSFLAGFKPQFAAPVAVALAAVFAVMLWPGADPIQDPSRGPGTFTTATSPATQVVAGQVVDGQAVDGPVLRVKLAESTDQVALDALLAKHKLTLVGQPSDSGVLTLRAVADSDAQKIVDALEKDPAVAFASVGANR